MSQSHNEHVTCPVCGHEQDFQAWEQIDVADHPELKERLISGELNCLVCSECNAATDVLYPLVYRDPVSYLMIWMLPGADLISRFFRASSRIFLRSSSDFTVGISYLLIVYRFKAFLRRAQPFFQRFAQVSEYVGVGQWDFGQNFLYRFIVEFKGFLAPIQTGGVTKYPVDLGMGDGQLQKNSGQVPERHPVNVRVLEGGLNLRASAWF